MWLFYHLFCFSHSHRQMSIVISIGLPHNLSVPRCGFPLPIGG